MEKINVGVLGATGTVGQKIALLLDSHPFFKISDLIASDKNKGKRYKEAVSWKQEKSIPAELENKIIKNYRENMEAKVFFSGMDATAAGEIENYFAEKGCAVISNSKNHRMDENVPISIPEVNPEHFLILKKQKTKGFIVTNSNCSTMFLALTLAPLHRIFGLEKVFVSTMQAVSGAGYPGFPSLDILANVVPYIGGEEEKIENELKKMFGTCTGEKIIPADFEVSAHCCRVPVIDGHTENVSLKFKKKPTVDEVKKALSGFRGLTGLPSAPMQPVIVMDENDRPQPRLDAHRYKGMTAFAGRIRKCSIFDIKMVIMGHNTIRGAAGAAVLNAEYLYQNDYFKEILNQ